MTNLSELKARYAALGAEIERLEAKPAVTDGPLTEAPSYGVIVWVAEVDGRSSRLLWKNERLENWLLAQGRIHATRESAGKASRKSLAEQKLRTIIAKHAPGWRADWTDVGQEKAQLFFNHGRERWEYSTCWANQVPGVIYFPPELFDTIISEMGEAMEDLL